MVCYPPRAAPLALAAPRHRDLQPARRRDYPLGPHGAGGGPKGYDKHRRIDKAQTTHAFCVAQPLTKHLNDHGTTQLTPQSCRTSDTALPTHRIPLPQRPRRKASANACNILCTICAVRVLVAFIAYMIEILTHELHICVPRHAYDGQPIFSTTANTLSIAQTAVCASNTSMSQPACHATQTHSALPPFLSCANHTRA